ncbi:MAG: phosphoribosylamine--glycine ligase, partial [Chroococcidiopsidaceae cyanobacterium CP_BM_ER_R8_30]|nr:phosphoribosylamine--glycine ligase [Chroococcidiopsidaceae cyanobacterium CP_BM_ER_R8_30]
CAQQRLSDLPPIDWKIGGAAVCVVLAAGGDPKAYQRGQVITGIAEAEALGAVEFHAGTKLQQQQLVTDGGRVLGITGIGESFEQARSLTYAACNCIRFEGMYYRRDIGYRIRGNNDY